MSELYEQGPSQIDATNKPVASLLDHGVIWRWAQLFAARYRTPTRAEEFSERITGAIAGDQAMARAIITSDADLEAVFHYARETIEVHVGKSVFTVSGSVREAARRDALRTTADRPARTSLNHQRVA